MCALALGCIYRHYQYPNLLEGADRITGQLRRDKECPFSGVTKSGRIWRKVPESDGRSVSYKVSSSSSTKIVHPVRSHPPACQREWKQAHILSSVVTQERSQTIPHHPHKYNVMLPKKSEMQDGKSRPAFDVHFLWTCWSLRK